MSKYVVFRPENCEESDEIVSLCKYHYFEVDEPDIGGVSDEDLAFLQPMMNGELLEQCPKVFFVDDGDQWTYIGGIEEFQLDLNSKTGN